MTVAVILCHLFHLDTPLFHPLIPVNILVHIILIVDIKMEYSWTGSIGFDYVCLRYADPQAKASFPL